MASRYYFDYLGTVWNNLPEKDKAQLAELWHGYEQVFAAEYQKFTELSLNIALADILPYSTERWLDYTFNSTNRIITSAVYTSTQDLSMGANLLTVYLIRFQVDSLPIVEVDLRGLTPQNMTIREIINKFNSITGFTFASTDDGTTLKFTSPTTGVGSRISWYQTSEPSKNACEFILGLLKDDLPLTIPKYFFTYSIGRDGVAEIPELKTFIREESSDKIGALILYSGTDYELSKDKKTISFLEEPPEHLWAKRTQIDDETPWNNFGFLMNIYDKNTPQYIAILQGLWFAFWNGPKPENLKRALYLLFTLPVAATYSTVTRVTETEIELLDRTGEIAIHKIPSGLNSLVTVGQEIDPRTPLVDGVDVFDKINNPGFITTEIGRANIQRFLTENATRGPGEDTDETKALRMLEEHTFLPQISVDAFISPDINLANVKTFLEAIKPLHKTFLFQVIVGTFLDVLGLDDSIGMDISMNITQNTDSNPTTDLLPADLLTYETVDSEGLDLDSDVLLFRDEVRIEVRSFGVLIDAFDA